MVDLFSGCGGLTLGVHEACSAIGADLRIPLAVDSDAPALACYQGNFAQANAVRADVRSIFRSFGEELGDPEISIREKVGHLDLLVGGPPCQGHSDLNNFSRRLDPKNALYLVMSRAAEVLRPRNILIENVLGAAHDRTGVVDTVAQQLESLGYAVAIGIVNSLRIGIPQRRRRLILLASLDSVSDVTKIEEAYSCNTRDLQWAIGDLVGELPSNVFTAPSKPNPETLARIDYLFDRDLFELPDSERPRCHRDKEHTYNSVYGRLRWDQPAQTITSGFYCMCMGRYVHPAARRTLTAHEAARIQFFPDFFSFASVDRRTSLAQIIGNAVPMKLSYVLAMELLK